MNNVVEIAQGGLPEVLFAEAIEEVILPEMMRLKRPGGTSPELVVLQSMLKKDSRKVRTLASDIRTACSACLQYPHSRSAVYSHKCKHRTQRGSCASRQLVRKDNSVNDSVNNSVKSRMAESADIATRFPRATATADWKWPSSLFSGITQENQRHRCRSTRSALDLAGSSLPSK